MHCIEPTTHKNFERNKRPYLINTAQRAIQSIAIVLAALALSQLAGCKSRPLPPHGGVISAPTYPSSTGSDAPAPVVSPSSLPRAANWAEYRRRAAQLILASNPGASFDGPLPAQWYGIATVTVQFNADGSIRTVELMRRSSISPEINNMAVEAVRRVGQFGSVGHLPQPWQFNETFLYNSDRLFQLDTIVANR